MTMDRLRHFFSLCNSLSGHNFAQGFGSNVSAKLGNGRMAIKASGAKLSDVLPGAGYAIIKYQLLSGIYSCKRCGSLQLARRRLSGSVAGGPSRNPSMEAGFHSFLGTYVAHLHPICFNAIACQRNAKKILAGLYGAKNFIWAGYARPGHALACRVKRAVGGRRACVVFLQNHGIIISSSSASDCLKKAVEIEARAETSLLSHGAGAFRVAKLKKTKNGWVNSSPQARSFASDNNNAWRFAFPDAAVFFSDSFLQNAKIRAVEGKGIEYCLPEREARAANEIFCAHMFILEAAGRYGKPAYLKKSEILALCGMNEEKNRRKAVGV
jgi:rhamnose utilization protein RhaD (predicted bifunctional aldolase and dehydrogenase)